MRIFLPATLAMLVELDRTGEFTPVGGTAFALTPALRESFRAGDDEELAEYALREAARASLRLLAAEHDGAADGSAGDDGAAVEGAAVEGAAALPPRRAVVAADVGEVTLRPDLDDAVVKISGVVPVGAIAAVHVDGAAAEPAVRAAVAVIDAADLGDQDAELALGDADDHDLGWYATQEVPFLLELL
ncbi:DUF6912 family protein [Gordonia soli]|uniref:Uncharacterized protein n=1 Tax=Gordonia soli NBRC 108243 TaxID=1223545 RepID=M0QDS0_9ACTN|nr:hypothetical protein [Gordonia soli]GAC66725.1 hypothetical protein GS4_03_01730 [Gordonia soli NBRC 108243]